MVTFHPDEELDGQLQRTLAMAYERAADIGEALATAARVPEGDYDAWYDEWSATAGRAVASGDVALAAGHQTTAVEAYLRASEYYRQAYMMIRRDLDDPRLLAGFRAMRAAFRSAAGLLPFPVETVEIPYEGSTLPGYHYRADDTGAVRPLIVYLCGYDSAPELSWTDAPSALRRGYDVLAFAGPGQGGALYEQRLPMRPDFEAVLTPAVDWALTLPTVRADGLVLVGRSFAGYLAPRGASSEPRIAALVCDPGQPDMGLKVRDRLPAELLALIEADDPAVDEVLEPMRHQSPASEEMWGARLTTHGHTAMRPWLREILTSWNLDGRAGLIACPTLVTEAEGDFAGGDSEILLGELTCPKTLIRFTDAEGAGGHCSALGQQTWRARVFDWIETTVPAGPLPSRAV